MRSTQSSPTTYRCAYRQDTYVRGILLHSYFDFICSHAKLVYCDECEKTDICTYITKRTPDLTVPICLSMVKEGACGANNMHAVCFLLKFTTKMKYTQKFIL